MVAKIRVADPVGSGVFAWIRIRFSNFSGSGYGSGFSTRVLDLVSGSYAQKCTKLLQKLFTRKNLQL